MKDIPAAHTGFYEGTDRLAHWKMDEGFGGSAAADDVGTYNLTAINTPDIAAAIYGNTADGSRSFNGTNQRFTLPGDAASLAAHQSEELTIEGWFTVDSISGSSRYIYYYGGDPVSAAVAEAILASVYVIGTEMGWRWENGGTLVQATTTGLSLQAGRGYYFGLSRTDSITGGPGTVDVKLSVYDLVTGEEHYEEWIAQQAPLDGANATFNVGSADGGASFFAGDIDELMVSTYARNRFGFRQSFARGARSYDLQTLFDCDNYQVRAKVLVRDSDEVWQDITNLFNQDFLSAVTWEDKITQAGKTATIRVNREIFDFSAAPFVETSPLNLDSVGTFAELFALSARIQIQTATVPLDYDAPDWAFDDLAFEGLVSKVDWGSEVMTVTCRDRIAALVMNYITTNLLTGSPRGSAVGIAVEEEMQLMLEEFAPAEVNAAFGTYCGEDLIPQVYTPVTPGWFIRQWNQENMSTYEALNRLAEQIGWTLRYKWDDNQSKYRLTFSEPNRSIASTTYTLTNTQVKNIPNISLDEADIRNWGRCYFGDRAIPDAIGDHSRVSATSFDLASINKYCFRPFEISLAATSNVDQAAEAQRLIDGAVADLSEPIAIATGNTSFKYFVELNDYYTFAASKRHSNTDRDLAITSYVHTLSNEEVTTQAGLRGKPSGNRKRLQGFIQQPGAGPVISQEPPPPPASVAGVSVFGGAWICFDPPAGNLNGNFDWAEIHVNAGAADFTPNSGTLQFVTRSNKTAVLDLDPSQEYSAKVVLRDRMGNIADPSPLSAPFTPKFRGSAGSFRARQIVKTGAFGTTFVQAQVFVEQHDPDGNYNDLLDEWTAPKDCVAFIGGTMSFTTTPAVTDVGIQIRVNGAVVAANAATASTFGAIANIGETLPLNSGDVVSIWCSTNDVGAPGSDPGSVFHGYIVED